MNPILCTDAYYKTDRTDKSKYIGKEQYNVLNDYPNLSSEAIGLTKRIGIQCSVPTNRFDVKMMV